MQNKEKVLEGIGNHEQPIGDEPLFLKRFRESSGFTDVEPVENSFVTTGLHEDISREDILDDSQGSFLARKYTSSIAKNPEIEKPVSISLYDQLRKIYTSPDPTEALESVTSDSLFTSISTEVRLNNAGSNADFINNRFINFKESFKGFKESRLYHKAAAVFSIGALALASCGAASSSRIPNGKSNSTNSNGANCDIKTLTNRKPANFKQYAFFPPYAANNPQTAGNVEISWFNKGPMSDSAVSASLAIEQAVIGDQASSVNGVVTQPDYKANFYQDYNQIQSDTSKPNKTAAGYCIELSRVMGETENYTNNFAVKGDRLLWLKAITNKRGEITGVDPVQVVWSSSTPMAGVEFSTPFNAARLGISGFPAELVTINGQVYVKESALPSGGVNNEIHKTGSAGNKVSPKSVPVGSASANTSTGHFPGVGKNAGGSKSEPTQNNITGVGASKGGEQSSPSPLPAPGKGPSQGGNVPTITTETPGAPSPTSPPETIPPTTTTPPETVPPTTTTILKSGDSGSTANNAGGTGQSDPFNAGGSSDSNNLGTINTLAQ